MTAEPLLAPRYGPPIWVETDEALAETIELLKAGEGPIAVDAERASGFRYSQRAYLVQVFRRGAGIHLIDPIAIRDTSLWAQMSQEFSDVEWVIHASTQDLPCLRELGIQPAKLFDTELGARIAGCERVGLGALSESLLELALAKEHSAVDWSLRPLKEDWLTYAALDVDVLVDLRDEVESILQSRGYLGYAQEEFASILKNYPTSSKPDPWRKTSGMHKVKDRMTLAIIRELWVERDRYAQEIDIAPGRIFNDESLVEIATKRPLTIDLFKKIILRRTRLTDLPVPRWFDLYRNVLTLSKDELPELRAPATGLPPQKLWRDRNPLGYARLTHARAAVVERAQELGIPAENLISPDCVRHVMWHNPPEVHGNEVHVADHDLQYVRSKLQEAGARAWQIGFVAAAIAPALRKVEPLPAPVVEPATTEPEVQ